MLVNKRDDQLRGEIIAQGGMGEIHDLELLYGRYNLQQREAYRAGLVELAGKYGIAEKMEIPVFPYKEPLPYGPARKCAGD